MEQRFNPQRVFVTPRHLKRHIRVAPRTISDDLWAKMLWAGLNLRTEIARCGDTIELGALRTEPTDAPHFQRNLSHMRTGANGRDRRRE